MFTFALLDEFTLAKRNYSILKINSCCYSNFPDIIKTMKLFSRPIVILNRYNFSFKTPLINIQFKNYTIT